MDTDDRQHLEGLLIEYTKRLRIREKQLALYGISVDPSIPIEVERLKEKIAGIQAKLGEPSWSVQSEPLAPPLLTSSSADTKLQSSRNQIFISYSHSDKRWLDRLHIHLKPLERDNTIVRWDDTMLKPGTKWREEIDQALKVAKVAILLVSADFLASDFITHNELPPLLKAAEEKGAVILPVIISACLFLRNKNLSQFQAVNDPSRPLNKMRRHQQDEVFVKITEAVEEALKRRTQSTAPVEHIDRLGKKPENSADVLQVVSAAAQKPTDQLNKAVLRQLLDRHFSNSELHDLCFDLNIDYERLPGQGKGDKARELVAYAERYGRIAELAAKCREIRPYADWESMYQTVSPQQRQTSDTLSTYQQYTLIKLDGNQYKRLVEALLSAFTSYDDFGVMLRFELDVHLETIVSLSGNLRDIAFGIVNWAETRGNLKELIQGARKHNPGNPELRTVAQELLGPNA
jgi:hypothetical protein